MASSALVGFIIVLIILAIIFMALKKVTKKNGIKRVHAIGFEGEGLVKRLIQLDLAKDGNILQADLQGKKFAVATSPVIFEDIKGKETLGYLVDMEKGCTISIQKAGSVTDLKTNPSLVSNVLDSRLIQEAFGLRPHRGIIIAVALLSMGLGIIMGLAF